MCTTVYRGTQGIEPDINGPAVKQTPLCMLCADCYACVCVCACCVQIAMRVCACACMLCAHCYACVHDDGGPCGLQHARCPCHICSLHPHHSSTGSTATLTLPINPCQFMLTYNFNPCAHQSYTVRGNSSGTRHDDLHVTNTHTHTHTRMRACVRPIPSHVFLAFPVLACVFPRS